MENLTSTLEDQRRKYREYFANSASEIQNRIEQIKPPNVYENIFFNFPLNSDGQKWQQEVLNILENEISKNIYLEVQDILSKRSNYSCNCCATCCNLACSEFSPEELQQRANNGDKFAKQFLSIFIPYNSKEEAKSVYPDYIELLDKNKEQNVYFYHCPKLSKDKKCSDYENRPQICRDFPDNPLTLLPASCGFCNWKNKYENIILHLHAMIEIVEYYKTKIPYQKI